MGNKYVFKADSNPPVGAYNPDAADKIVRPKTRDVLIKEESFYRKIPDPSPEPGSYSGHIKPFGSEVKPNVSMGSKYIFKAD